MRFPLWKRFNLTIAALSSGGLTLGKSAKYRASALVINPMNSFSNIFYNAFRGSTSVKKLERTTRESRKDIVRAHAHGNIRLQMGHWYTQGDVNDWRSSLRGYSFTD